MNAVPYLITTALLIAGLAVFCTLGYMAVRAILEKEWGEAMVLGAVLLSSVLLLTAVTILLLSVGSPP